MELNIDLQLKRLRNERGITQKDLADMLNTSFQTISKWETGASLPDINHLPYLADIFNVSIEELLGTNVRRPEKLYDLGRLLLDLCIIARQYGILKAEQEISGHSSSFLKYAIRLLYEVQEPPEYLEVLLRNKLKYSGFPTNIYIYNSMITDVVAAWRANCHPYLFRSIILTYFSDEQAEEFKKRNPLYFPTLERFLADARKTPLTDNTVLLETLLDSSKTIEVEKVFRSVPLALDTMGIAIKGASAEVAELFIKSLPLESYKERLMFAYNTSHEYEPDIINCQKEILALFD